MKTASSKSKVFHYQHHLAHVKAVYQALQLIFEKDHYADQALEKVMRANKKWGVKDRSFVADTVYDMVRNWRLLLVTSDVELVLNEKNFWTLFGVWLVLKGYDLPDVARFNHLSIQKIQTRFEKYSRIRKIRESVPDWLDKVGEKELGKRWDEILTALNQPPKMVLRTNTLKAQVKDLQKILEESRVETETLRWSPLALELPFSRNVFRVPAFKEGLFEVQDAASQMVSDLLGPQPGMRVIDACAGSGGKTLHLAAIMQNKGKIIALDNKEFKLQELKKRAKRAGATIIETREITSSKSIKRLYETADKLLIDAPCSGLGVLRRNPDAKWKLKEDEIIAMRQQQAELWDKYAPMTKKGGHMVYAVCSILPSEGEEQLDGFMKRNSGKWKVLAEKRYSPEIHQADGFYMCLLERLA